MQSYGAFEFISELGGSWGLFLGASFVTAAHGLDTLVVYILTRLESGRGKRNKGLDLTLDHS